jgi:two-component system, OmpR family, phosphate regulon sensor histidine kinase PhoR
MTLSLRGRLFLATSSVVVLALALVTLLAARQERAWLVDRSAELLERMARHAIRDLQLERARLAIDWQAAAQELGAAHGYRITLIDSSGRVVGDSRVSRERLPRVENHAGRPEVRAALAGHAGRALRRSGTIGVDLLYVAVPVSGVPGIAVLRFAEPLAEVARLRASLVRLLVTAALVSLVLTLALILWLTGRQAARIAELERIAERLGSGEPGARARERPNDEVGRLGHAINRMAAELRLRLEALERERDEREQILAHMSDGMALVDGAGRVVRANRSLAEILGAALPPPPGTPLRDFARSPELDELIEGARRGARTVERDLRLWAPRHRLVRATATRLHGDGSGAVLLVLHDLTEMEQLSRIRQDFVANVSHELKTPLTSVRGYAETLLEGGLDDAEHRAQFVRVIRDQAARLQSLVEDLLSLAQLERPDARLRLERFDLREAVERQIANLRDRAERAGLQLELVGPPQPVTADRARLDQVVANLLDNALKYTEHGGVRVALGGDDAHAWCEVQDTGPGIPEDDQARVFERFYRVDKARSREKGGTGLGLSIVKHIVALHGGEVTVRSTVDRGSTFRFEIPRMAAPPPG